MRVVLGSTGSRGDAIPILEIATRLQARGHDVHVFTTRHFAGEAAARGLPHSFFETDSQELMKRMETGLRASQRTMEWLRRAMLEQIDALLPVTAEADALVTMVNELGAPTVAEYHHIPHFRVCVVPCLFGDQPPAVQPLQRLPIFLNRLLWEGVELGTRLIFGRALNAKRQKLGLSRVRAFCDYAAGYSRNLLAMDPVLLPPARGWRHRYEYVGYPFGGDEATLAPAIEAFLAAGPRPVYLGFGSVYVPHPERTTRMILDAINQVGCRAILDAGWAGLGAGAEARRDVLVVQGAPHRQLFPRMAGLVHHGGSGTTHNATRAGVPQAIVPQMLDQYFWGERIRHLGLGPAPVPYAGLTTAKLAGLLRELLAPTYRHQARAVAGLMRPDGVDAIIASIERARPLRVATERGIMVSLAAAAAAPRALDVAEERAQQAS
jgi:vancomycin aglycone glucosyltransferase